MGSDFHFDRGGAEWTLNSALDWRESEASLIHTHRRCDEPVWHDHPTKVVSRQVSETADEAILRIYDELDVIDGERQQSPHDLGLIAKYDAKLRDLREQQRLAAEQIRLKAKASWATGPGTAEEFLNEINAIMEQARARRG